MPSIAAENRNYPQGAEYMAQARARRGIPEGDRASTTDGKPGVFATLDAGAAKTVGLYFMYDVKQFDPAEWSSPPLEARIVDKPGFGKVIVGRGAVNQKGPEAAFLAALHAIHGAGKKMPVNLVLVAEGEEEIGSPHIGQLAHRPEVEAALKKTVGVFMPSASQDPNGVVTVSLGAKGVVELELVASGEKWGRGPSKDVHSSLKAMVDSPAWRLVKALDTLVSADGNTILIDNYPQPRPLSAAEKGDDREGRCRPRAKSRRRSSSACSTGSTTCRGCRRTSASNRSRPSTSKASSAATPGRAARPCCRIARSPRSTCASCRT